MQARIRYGNEADVLQTIANSRASTRGLDYDSLREHSPTVLSFSTSVSEIPELPTFDTLLADLGVQINKLPNLGNNDPIARLGKDEYFTLKSIGTVEITNPDKVDIERLRKLARGLFNIANRHSLASDGILFIDHSIVPGGDIIAMES